MRNALLASLLALAPFLAHAQTPPTPYYSTNCKDEEKDFNKAKKGLEKWTKKSNKVSDRITKQTNRNLKGENRIQKDITSISGKGTMAFDACVAKLTAAGTLSRLGNTPTFAEADITACSKGEQKKIKTARRRLPKLEDSLRRLKELNEKALSRLRDSHSDATSEKASFQIEVNQTKAIYDACKATLPAPASSPTPGNN